MIADTPISHGWFVGSGPEGALFLIGNAKARRRWRRRHVPNAQQTAALERERRAIAEAFK